MESVESAPAPDIPVEGRELGHMVEVGMEFQYTLCTFLAALFRLAMLRVAKGCFIQYITVEKEDQVVGKTEQQIDVNHR